MGSRGSGYLIAPGRVLTAAHVVAGASVVRVRLDVGQDTEIDVQAESWWADPAGHGHRPRRDHDPGERNCGAGRLSRRGSAGSATAQPCYR